MSGESVVIFELLWCKYLQRTNVDDLVLEKNVDAFKIEGLPMQYKYFLRVIEFLRYEGRNPIVTLLPNYLFFYFSHDIGIKVV